MMQVTAITLSIIALVVLGGCDDSVSGLRPGGSRTEPATPSGPAHPPTTPYWSAEASNYGYSASPDKAIDGDNDTFWCAGWVPAWFRLDLGESRSVTWLHINVHYHTVLRGSIEVLTDIWSSTTLGTFDTIASDTGIGNDDSEQMIIYIGRRIRYIRINFTQTDAPRSLDTTSDRLPAPEVANGYKACISEVWPSRSWRGTTGTTEDA